MMGGKNWALQAGTSHNLGDNFGRVFNIEFLARDGERKFAFNTSWGMSQRVIGAIIMVHGDEAGLKIPPTVAPIQVAVLPIRLESARAEEDALDRVATQLRPIARFSIDQRNQHTVGYKIQEWELKGVPLRLELGPDEVTRDSVTLVRRDTGERTQVPISALGESVEALLSSIQNNLFDSAKRRLDEHTVPVNTYAHLAERVANNAGWSLASWCGTTACEETIKRETKATIRCLPLNQDVNQGRCIVCDERGSYQAVIARAY
jgi:prolyl-tRNA synthetase